MKESEEDRLKCAVYESTRAPLTRSPFPNGEGSETRIPLFSTQRLPQRGRQRGGGFAAKKEANPASLRSAVPSKGRGSRGYSLLPMEGGAPKGRRLDGGSGMKEREIISSTPFARAPYPPLFSTQRLSQGGRLRGGGFSTEKGSQPRLAALGSPFQGKGLAWTLPPSYGRRCPEGAEVGGGKRYERERGNASQVDDKRKHPIHRCAVPLPQWGRLRNESNAIPETQPSLMGKAKRCVTLRP